MNFSTLSQPASRARVLQIFLFAFALWSLAAHTRAQFYVGNATGAYTIGSFDAATGAPIHSNLITGLDWAPMG